MPELNLPVKLDLTGLDVDAMVKQAVMESAIGEELRRAIKERLSGYDFKRTIERVVDDAIHEAARKVLSQPEFAERIRKAVEAGLTDEVVSQFIDKSFKSWRDR